MACCGTSSSCGTGYDGAGGAVVDRSTGAVVHYQDGPCSLMNPGPRMCSSGGAQVSCQCCCIPDCPPCGAVGYGAGRNSGTKIDIFKAPVEVTWAGSYLMKQCNAGQVSTSCYDPCCGPC